MELPIESGGVIGEQDSEALQQFLMLYSSQNSDLLVERSSVLNNTGIKKYTELHSRMLYQNFEWINSFYHINECSYCFSYKCS